jgi:hypothetical protein
MTRSSSHSTIPQLSSRLVVHLRIADSGFGGSGDLAVQIAVLFLLVHLVVRDSLAGHAAYLRFVFEGSTVAPTPGPTRNKSLTGQHSCRQPAKVIVVNQL